MSEDISKMVQSFIAAYKYQHGKEPSHQEVAKFIANPGKTSKEPEWSKFEMLEGPDGSRHLYNPAKKQYMPLHEDGGWSSKEPKGDFKRRPLNADQRDVGVLVAKQLLSDEDYAKLDGANLISPEAKKVFHAFKELKKSGINSGQYVPIDEYAGMFTPSEASAILHHVGIPVRFQSDSSGPYSLSDDEDFNQDEDDADDFFDQVDDNEAGDELDPGVNDNFFDDIGEDFNSNENNNFFFDAGELLIGGEADGLPSSAFDLQQLQIGIRVEMEHSNNPQQAEEIAKDHLKENPNYYKKLKQAGL